LDTFHKIRFTRYNISKSLHKEPTRVASLSGMKSDLMTDSLTKINSRTFYRYNVVVFLIKVKVHIIFSAFTEFGKATISFVISVRPFVRMEKLNSHWTDFHEVLYLSIFRKYIDKIQVSLKYDNNNVYSTWRPIYI